LKVIDLILSGCFKRTLGPSEYRHFVMWLRTPLYFGQSRCNHAGTGESASGFPRHPFVHQAGLGHLLVITESGGTEHHGWPDVSFDFAQFRGILINGLVAMGYIGAIAFLD
jgi:hypothetical protein